eukprot:TRINITY_DN43692_c0_g1_i1.p1 TRINITY_DN43692_c0_g1~~TRINITY_DN43692_c0_g1_i1.p1  ORF type:complete len:293 (+),score=72.65 TRINITY_DN43692_c0_g1_i1:126-881(+)
MFARAANLFKMAKKWSDAGKTFTRIAEIHKKNGNKHDAATNFVDASTCFKKSDPKEAAASLQKAIDIYTESGRFTIAAKHHQTIAEIFEGEGADLDKAMHHYQQSADFFRGEESNSSANKCMLKVAEFASKLEQYEKAIGIYEKVAGDALESSLLKYSAKEYFFRASLCHLCIDALNAQHAVEKYGDLYPAFGDSREAKLIKTLAGTIEEQDVEAFTAATQEFDSISRLEAFHTTLLLRVKKQIPVEDDLC